MGFRKRGKPMRSQEEILEKIKWYENTIKRCKDNIEILKWTLENESEPYKSEDN